MNDILEEIDSCINVLIKNADKEDGIWPVSIKVERPVSVAETTSVSACTCTNSCGSNYSQGGGCICSSSCGSNYSRG